MSSALQIIDELETVLKTSSTEKHLSILRKITDLFLAGRNNISEEAISVFDDVVVKLADHVERRALIELGGQLAPIANAPPNTIRSLASNEDIAVAGPVLAQSPCLTDQDLVTIAGSKSQSHLGKIAERAQISPVVTDILVGRGDREVVNKVAANAGAQFSRTSMSMLVMRAGGDDDLTHIMGLRPDIPPNLFKRLIRHATEQVRQRLLAAAPPSAQDAINRVLMQIAEQTPPKSLSQADLTKAQRLTYSYGQDTEQTRTNVLEYADGKKIPELAAALSILSAVPLVLVSRLICDSDPFGAMVLCKAIRLDWSIAQAVLAALPGANTSDSTRLEELLEDYERLSASSAHHLLGYWQSRQARQKLP
jgi:uncharacterized protein (DUF2336 family)